MISKYLITSSVLIQYSTYTRHEVRSKFTSSLVSTSNVTFVF